MTTSPTKLSTAKPPRPGLTLFIASGATFLAFLDVTVVNVAIPALLDEFPDASLADLTWILTGYGVLFAALLTPAGRLADVTGRRRLFIGSVLAFSVTSALVAIAPDLRFLIAARVLQGAAAAGMIPSALGLILAVTPLAHRTAAVGAWAGAGSMAAAVGPALGGLLIEVSSWRLVFLINVPIGLAMVALTHGRLAADRPSGRRLPDPAGTLAVAAGIGLLVLGLTQGADWGWPDARTLGSLAGGCLLLSLSLARSVRHPAPAVEMDLWRSRTFSIASAGCLVFGVALFAWMLLAPVFLTSAWRYSILEAGLGSSPAALTSAAGAFVVGRLIPPRGRRAAAIAGTVLFTASAAWFYALLDAEPHYLTLFLPAGLVSGFAIGAVLTAFSSAAVDALPPQRFAAGTGLVITARQLGGALGVAGVAAILSARAADGVTALLDVGLFCAIAGAVAVVPALLLRTTDTSDGTPQPPAGQPVTTPAQPPLSTGGGRP